MAPLQHYDGGMGALRHRLVLATLSGRPVRVVNIRANEDDVGLRDHEIKFLNLLSELTNGSTVEINHTGTALLYRPGAIRGGRVTFDCGTERAIGYFLEPLLALLPFGKMTTDLTLTGITNDNVDISADLLRTVSVPLLKRFGIEDGLELKITKRGAAPLGGGEVQFHCPTVRAPKALQFVEEGRVKRIRGMAYATRVSPQTANRLVESSRSLLNRFIPDVYIYSDVYKGAESGKYITVAESTTGILLAAEWMGEAGGTPEDAGLNAAKLLYRQIAAGGCVDVTGQWLALVLMTLCDGNMSKVRMGALSEFTIQFLRDVRDFLGVTFKIKEEQSYADSETKTLLLSCLGTAFVNVNRKAV